MSESFRPAPDVREARPRLVGRHLARVFAVTFMSLTGVFLLLSVVPMYAVSGGAGRTGAGVVTGSLMLTTVLAELALPRLMARFGYVPVLAAGLLLLGLPPLALVASSGMPAIIAVSLVRGFGFGVVVVVPNAMVAALAPPERRGEALGLFGLTAGLPTVLALPVGVWLAEEVGYTPVFAASTVVSVAALAALPGLPRGLAAASAEGSFGIVAGLRSPGLLRPAAAFASTAMAAGVLITFLPEAVPAAGVAAAALFVQPAATTLTRWQAGRAGDRHGAARLLAPAVALSAAGVALLVLVPDPVAVFASMVLFGAGFGVTQNASLALMYERAPVSGYGTVSAIWNIGYDGGMGIGGVAFGIAATHAGYPVAFGLTAVLISLTLPLAFRGRGARPPRTP
ncbi:putative MFS family arabinose efflux permease [Actinomadura hallensis]|uniref:Putative MFS family arabinose efflux permease n=1 Tax=Actinomadura hallensis TaxID=337895 RepID=A0A543IBM4_9ACTN|nr:MFS transporter [Actinomadura hallensis]TQM67974.1 putative MFS family arabinose efflux permease [Actinomadura hallensis]HLV71291.1 MFS transporter [Vulgatibacteraceae bacterium]